MDWYNQQQGFGLMGGTISRGSALGGMQNQQQYANQMQQAYYNPTTYTSTTSTNLMSSDDYARFMAGATAAVQQTVKKVAKSFKKTGKILLDLRKEIDDWHGDILMRAA